MSLAIKFGDTSDTNSISGFIYFDAVLNYTRNLSAKVTSHPIDAGADITDHVITENPKFTIKGVVTGADISGIAQSLEIDGAIPLNTNVQPIALTVSNLGEGLIQYLPDVIKQFMGVTAPTIVVDESERVNYSNQIYNILEKLMTGLVLDKTRNRYKNRMTVVSLYELEGNKLEKKYGDLIITNFTVDEDADTGDGMFFSMSLEKVNFVTLEKVELPKDVSKELTKAVKPKAKKAKADSDPKPVEVKSTDSPIMTPPNAPTRAESEAALNAKLNSLNKK